MPFKGKAPTKQERELGALLMLERQLMAFVGVFSRARENHEPFRRALEHAKEQRILLSAALAGDKDAKRARAQSNEPESLG